MIKNKHLLIISGVTSVLLIVWEYVGNYRLCEYVSSDGKLGNCPEILSSLELLLVFAIPLFVLTILIRFLSDAIYESWFRFVRWWIPLSIFLTAVAPAYSHDWMFPIEKGNVTFLMTSMFVVVSIIIITFKYFSLKRPR